ncbi:Mitochondrial carrier domain [Pseudocohnilembus persalinus]|uniref:Mitochondrial carrier domain n=1 Tax=Pseudocohnilembus persalinus TaxID=266149 RepID=A0A0V0QCG2_PSEPJ|nr:Mitochondrial carrier domain [Pseudocohnilembus persalinus]|eukprot:KRW99896.1 Mitochondrial carrier domain [Pseudocohnilembus persalinus]
MEINPDNNQNQSVNDQVLQQQLIERLEQTRHMKSQEFNDLKQKSFILREKLNAREQRQARTAFQRDSDIDHLVEKINNYEQEKKMASQYSWMDGRYWKYVFKNNIDLMSLLLMESTLMIGIYPILTIKTRQQAHHKLEDVCFFYKNNARKAPFYYGIGQAMTSLFVGNVIGYSVYKLANIQLNQNPYTTNLGLGMKNTLAFCIGDIVSSPFRIFFEVKRMAIQLNVQKYDHDQFLRNIRKSLLPFMLRDVSFRLIFNNLYNFMLYSDLYVKKWQTSNQDEQKYLQNALDRQNIPVTHQRQSTCLLISTFATVFLTNPIDMALTRLACQQYHKYTGFVNCLKTIYSGFGFRTAYFLITGSAMVNFYEPIRSIFSEAYE